MVLLFMTDIAFWFLKLAKVEMCAKAQDAHCLSWWKGNVIVSQQQSNWLNGHQEQEELKMFKQKGSVRKSSNREDRISNDGPDVYV